MNREGVFSLLNRKGELWERIDVLFTFAPVIFVNTPPSQLKQG